MQRRKTLLYEKVLEHVKSSIIEGTYRPGDRLPPVTALAQELGVGVSTVREGMRALASLGLVKVQQGHGTFITEYACLSEDPLEAFALAEDSSLAALLEVRLILEPLVAGMAAERAEPEELEAIMATVQEQERQHHLPDGDPFAADMEFHQLILQAAKNPVLTRMMEAVTEVSLESRRRTARIEGMMSKGIHFHYLIASAIQQRDVDQEQRLMKEHILDTNNQIVRSFRSVPPAAHILTPHDQTIKNNK
jgi:GntR family transcriptional repressor for pyruvate dehydrogenase complex